MFSLGIEYNVELMMYLRQYARIKLLKNRDWRSLVKEIVLIRRNQRRFLIPCSLWGVMAMTDGRQLGGQGFGCLGYEFKGDRLNEKPPPACDV